MNRLSKSTKIVLLFGVIACLLLARGVIRDRIFESDTHPELGEVDSSAVVRKGRLQFVRNFELGQKLAAEKNLPCFYFFTASWCTFCHEMEKEAFADPGVKQLADRFICVVVDADEQPKICQRRRVTGFPTIQIVSPDGVLLHHLEGVQTSESLVAAMQSALQRFAWLHEGETLVR